MIRLAGAVWSLLLPLEATMLARRSVQKMLEESVTYLSAEQVRRFVTHLNRNNRDSIEAEWELIMLAALASGDVTVALHISNRSLNLAPAMRGLAQYLG
jgi:hypothetical protein